VVFEVVEEEFRRKVIQRFSVDRAWWVSNDICLFYNNFNRFLLQTDLTALNRLQLKH
jgi:hypothetical protein